LEPESAIKVWDAATGRLERTWPSEHSFVAFSPDGQWLLGGGPADYRLWEVGSWEPGPVFPRDRRDIWAGAAGFRPDGRVLAVARSPQHIQLLDFARRREIATLEGPDQPNVWWPRFSPDGSLLAVPTTHSNSIQVWDLGTIDRRLRALGLGCDLLPGSPGASTPGSPSDAAGPRVRVFQEDYEAEYLPVVDFANAGITVQDMKLWGRERWSNGTQMLCDTSKGGFVELQVDVAETGRYALEVRLTHAHNFGLVEMALDGQKLDPVFDGYHQQVKPSGPIRLGTVKLRQGSHRLRFTAVDRNPKSVDYYIGIDCVKLTPAGD
jgi:WD40 repeat protein